MRTRYVILSAALLLLALAGVGWASGLYTARTTDCCQLNSDCCNPPSECCSAAQAKTDATLKTKASCCPGDCCPGPCCGSDCCDLDLPCCQPASACCVSAKAKSGGSE